MKAILLFSTLAVAFSTATADISRGKALHEASCTQCHGTEVYTREDRFVNDADALAAQVKRCHANVGAEWDESQMQDVVQYLDKSFYNFQ